MLWKCAILTTAVLIGGCDSVCENEISESVRSPSGSMRAVVFNRDCGATVGMNTQVSVLPADAPLPNDSGNVLIVDGSISLAPRWETDSSLHIVGVLPTRIFKQDTVVAGIRVTYVQ